MRTRRSSERAPAGTPSGDADVAGGWLPSLTLAFGVAVGTQVKATIQYIVQTRLPGGQKFTAANLDVAWMDLAQHVAGFSRPSKSTSQLRVRITRPDGAVTETFARLSGITVSATGEPPGRLVFDDLSPADAPIGSQVTLLGYGSE